MVLVMLIGTTTPVWATNNIKSGFDYVYGSSFKTKTNGIYKYELYKGRSTGVIVYTGAFLTIPMNHLKGNGSQRNTGTLTGNISWNSTVSWNTSIGASVGLADLVSIAANMGYGSTKGWSVSASYAYSISLSESEIKNAPTGCYAIAAGKPHYMIKWKKRNWITNKYISAGCFYMPYGSVTSYIVQSTNNQKSWQIYK